jgi:hypothetical protein
MWFVMSEGLALGKAKSLTMNFKPTAIEVDPKGIVFQIAVKNISRPNIILKLYGVKFATEAQDTIAFDLIGVSGRGVLIFVKERGDMKH